MTRLCNTNYINIYIITDYIVCILLLQKCKHAYFVILNFILYLRFIYVININAAFFEVINRTKIMH